MISLKPEWKLQFGLKVALMEIHTEKCYLHRAQFEGKLSRFDKRDKYDTEIDKELLEMYKR
jgi:hypothetical protein